MADRTIAVDFIAKNDKFISPVDQMNKQMSKMATVADYAKKSLLTIAAAAAVVGVALLVPHKYMQALISDFQTGFSKLASLASTGAAAVGQRISSALGTGFGKIIKSQLSGLVSIPLAHLAIGGATVLGAGLAYAAKQAINFDAEMRNTNSVLNLNEGQFRKTSAAVLDISRKYPIAAASLAQALYRIASAGFTSAADSTTVLEKSALAATAGVTDVGTAGVAVTSVMKAYGLSAQDAGHVTDILFQSVKQGQFSFQDLAGNLSDFIGLAKNTGSTVEETFAAFSLMSLSIGDAAQSSTALRGVFSALINPSTDMTKVVHALGFETTTAMVKQLGLVQTVQALSAAVNGNVTAMGALFPDVRGLNGALALTATSADQAAQTVKNFTDQGRLSGAAQRAYAEQMKAAKVSVDQFLNVLKTTAIQIGTSLLPILQVATNFLTTMVNTFQSLPGPVKDGAGVILGLGAALIVLGATMKLISANTAIFKFALEKLGGGSAVSGVQKVGSAITGMATQTGVGTLAVKGLGAAFSTLAGAIGPVMVGLLAAQAVASFSDNIRKTKQNVKDLASDLLTATQQGGDFGKAWDKAASFDWQGGFGGLLTTVHDFILGSKDAQTQLANMDQALALLVKSGNAKAATDAYDKLVHSFKDGSVEQKDFIGQMNAYRNALRDNTADNNLATAAQDAAGNSAQNAIDKYKGLGSGVLAANDAIAQLKEHTDSLNYSQQQLIQTMSSIGSAPVDSLDAIVQAEQDAASAATKVGKATKTSALDIESAQLGILRAIQTEIDARKALADAQSKSFTMDIVKAERTIAQSYDDTDRAIQKLQEATTALDILRHPPANTVASLERDISKAYDDSRAAIVNLQDATKALEELRHPTVRTVQAAEEALARAHNAQATATADLAKAQDQLNQARDHGTPLEVAASERNLIDAQWNLVDSQNAVVDAQKAYDDLTKNTPDRQRKIDDAERAVNDAKRQVADTQRALNDTQKAYNELTQDTPTRLKAIHNAELDVRDATRGVADALAATYDATKALDDLRRQQADQPHQIYLSELSVQEAVLGVKQAHQQLTDTLNAPDAAAGSDKFNAQQAAMKVSVKQLDDQLKIQIKEHQDYWQNVITVAQQYGPAVAQEFLKMGMKSSGIVAEMARGVNADTQQLADDLVRNAAQGTGAFRAIMEANMSALPGTVRGYTGLAAAALAEELGIGVDRAKAILDSFGLKMQDSTSSFMKEVSPGRFRQYTPGQGYHGPTFEAEGDVINGHEPQISHRMRVWAEPETGGEAYIPLASSKRKRSEKLLQHVAGIFGMQMYASGGIAPKGDDFGTLLGQGLTARLSTPVAVGERLMSRLQQEFLDSFSSVAGSTPSYGGGGGVDRWAGLASIVANMLGQPGSVGAILRRTAFESGGDPNVVNTTDSNWYAGHPSVGLEQVIAGTFAANADQYRGVGPFLYGVSVDPFANMYAGMNYATRRYGSIAAVDPLRMPTGYDRGGWLPPKSQTLAVNNTSYWERVGGGGGRGNVEYHVPVHVDARVASNVDLDKAGRIIKEEVETGVEEALRRLNQRNIARNGR